MSKQKSTKKKKKKIQNKKSETNYDHPGQPTKYSDEAITTAKLYLAECINRGEIPYIERLAYELDITSETIRNWAKATDKDGLKKHSEFFWTIKKIEDMQKYMLLNASINKEFNASGAIFQLKANHGMIETEKKILANDQDQPLEGLIVIKNAD